VLLHKKICFYGLKKINLILKYFLYKFINILKENEKMMKLKLDKIILEDDKSPDFVSPTARPSDESLKKSTNFDLNIKPSEKPNQ